MMYIALKSMRLYKSAGTLMWKHVIRLLTSREVIAFCIAEIFAGIAISVVVWKITGGGKEGLAWALASVALLLIVAGRLQTSFFLLDTRQRFEEVDHFLELVASLRTSVFRDPGMARNLTSIVEGAAQGLRMEDQRFADYIRQRLSDCALEMEGFASSVRAPALISTYWAAEKLTESKEVFATTYSGALKTFWMTPGGLAYIQANVDAHEKHGTSITRAFILDETPISQALEDILRKHVKGGLGIWVVSENEVDLTLLDDYVMFDYNCIALWESAHASNSLTHARWTYKPELVQKGIEMRRYLEYRSRRFTTEEELDAWLLVVANKKN